jgi:predicted phosphoribosyltransferase
LKKLGLGADDSIVLGLVRGGAVVARAVAAACSLPWDVFVVRKIGAPDQPEYAVGAVCETGRYITNQSAIDLMHLDDEWVNRAVEAATARCLALSRELRTEVSAPDLEQKRVVLVDDGIATGLTMRAAIAGVRRSSAREVLVAVPVLAPDALRMLRSLEVPAIYLAAPAGFRAVGQYYADFRPVTTTEVVELLSER